MLEAVIHALFFSVGVIGLLVAALVPSGYWEAVLINLGTSLIVTTVIFSIFAAFQKRDLARLSSQQAASGPDEAVIRELRKVVNKYQSGNNPSRGS
jgi:hypothetical protein